MARTGRPKKDEVRDVKFMVRMTKAEYAELTQYVTDHLSATDIVRIAIQEYLHFLKNVGQQTGQQTG